MSNKNLVISDLEMQLRQEPHNALLRWQLIKAKYEVVEAGGQVLLGNAALPTIYEDGDARKMMADLDPENKMQILGQIRSLSETQEEYRKAENTDRVCDVYLAFDPNGSEDSAIAEEIYKTLDSSGIATYYEPAMRLVGHPGAHRLFALEHAKVVILIGTDRSHLLVPETEGAWRRCLNMMDRTNGKHLLPAYRGMRPEDFPENLSKIQGIDMGRIGSVQAILLPRVKELLGKEKQAIIITGADGKKVNISSLFTRIRFFLEDSDYAQADSLLKDFSKKHGTEYGEYHLLRMMCDHKVSNDTDLVKVLDPADPALKKYLSLVDADRAAEVRNLLAGAEELIRKDKEAALVEEVRNALNNQNYKEVIRLVDEIKKMPDFRRFGDVEGFYMIASDRLEASEICKEYRDLVGDGSEFYINQLKRKEPEKYTLLTSERMDFSMNRGPVFLWLAAGISILCMFVSMTADFGEKMPPYAVAYAVCFAALTAARMKKGNSLVGALLKTALTALVIPFAIMLGLTAAHLIDGDGHAPLDFLYKLIAVITRAKIEPSSQWRTLEKFVTYGGDIIILTMPAVFCTIIKGVKSFLTTKKQADKAKTFNKKRQEVFSWMPQFEKQEYQELVEKYKDVVGDQWIEPISQRR